MAYGLHITLRRICEKPKINPNVGNRLIASDRSSGDWPFPFWSVVAIGIVLLIWSSLFLLSFAVLALISPSHFQTQRHLVFVALTILVAVSGIFLILSGRASEKKKQKKLFLRISLTGRV